MEEQQQHPVETPEEIPASGIAPFDPLPVPPKNRFSRKRVILVVVGFFILAGIGFGAAIFTSGKESSTSTTSNESQTTQSNQQTNSTTDVPVVAGTKTLKSDFPRIELTYPENWTATENREQEGIRVESPEFTYTSITGSPVKGYFRIYIRQGSRQQDSKYIGRGVAMQTSEKLAYTEPLPTQRTETDLSFFGLDSSDNFAFIMLTPGFILQKDESLGPDYAKEAEAYVIAGGYSAPELTDDLATNPVPNEYFSTTNAYKQGLDILKSLKIY